MTDGEVCGVQRGCIFLNRKFEENNYFSGNIDANVNAFLLDRKQ